MIRLTVKGVAVDSNDNCVLVLEDNQERALLIEVNRFDAHLLSLGSQGIKLDTPMFFDLIGEICNITGCKITKAYISGLKGDAFEAKVEISYDGKAIILDVRPTDAVLLALHNNVPILMDRKLEQYLDDTPVIKDTEVYYLN